MNVLTNLLDDKFSNVNFKGMKAGENSFSHLLHVDDVLDISKASVDNAEKLKDILDYFSTSFRLFVNHSKSLTIFAKDCIVVDNICHILNIGMAQNTLTYLCLLIYSKRLLYYDF